MVRCERSSAFVRRTSEPFSRGNARCTSRPDSSSSCSLTPTLSALPSGASSVVLVPRPGGACCFRFRPDPLAHIVNAILVQTPIPPEGQSRWQYVISFGYCPARVWLCQPTQPDVPPHLKPDRRNLPATGTQQCSYAVPRVVSHLRSPNLKPHDVWQHFFFSVIYMQVRTYCRCATCFFGCWLLYHSLAGGSTDCLLHVRTSHVLL